jgi:hypothetical protein
MEIEGVITEFKELITFTKNDRQFQRQIVSVASKDRQIVFIELRGRFIDKLRSLKLEVGDTAIFEFMFLGSDKNGNYYNNVVAKDIRYGWEKK